MNPALVLSHKVCQAVGTKRAIYHPPYFQVSGETSCASLTNYERAGKDLTSFGRPSSLSENAEALWKEAPKVRRNTTLARPEFKRTRSAEINIDNFCLFCAHVETAPLLLLRSRYYCAPTAIALLLLLCSCC